MTLLDDLHEIAPLTGGEFVRSPVVHNNDLDLAHGDGRSARLFRTLVKVDLLAVEQQRQPFGVGETAGRG